MSGDTKKATKAASAADILKHAGGSESDAWNNYIGAQALASIRPYIGDEEKRDKMRAIVTAGLTGIAPRDEVEGMIAAQNARLSRHRNGMLQGRLEQQAPRAPVA
jgi:hypothetical protein